MVRLLILVQKPEQRSPIDLAGACFAIRLVDEDDIECRPGSVDADISIWKIVSGSRYYFGSVPSLPFSLDKDVCRVQVFPSSLNTVE